jgi:hypothetical protein
MLSPTISISERVNRLSLKAALLYTWLLAHADDQGRLSGDAKTVKAIVCPLRDDITREEIPRLLTEIEMHGLIYVYSPGDSDSDDWCPTDTIIQIADWWSYQMLREAKLSTYPPLRDWQDRVGKQSRDSFGRYISE